MAQSVAAANKPQRIRLSFCCDRDGCRKRVTPPSVRFLGRKVFLAVAVILISAITKGRHHVVSANSPSNSTSTDGPSLAGRSSGAINFPGHHSGRSHAPVWSRLSRSPPCPTPSWTPSANPVPRASARVGPRVKATMTPAGTPPHTTLLSTRTGSFCFAFSRRSRSPGA